jgi:hypothetical protein
MSNAMNMHSLDTHAAVKELTALGLAEAQAEGIVSLVGRGADANIANLATKDELRAEIAGVKADLRVEIANAKTDIIRWMLASQGLLLAAIVALAQFTKLL